MTAFARAIDAVNTLSSPVLEGEVVATPTLPG